MADKTPHSFSVAPDDEGVRLDRFLAEKMRRHGLSREKVKELIKKGKVTLDGQRLTVPKHILLRGERITLEVEPTTAGIAPEAGDIAVLYKDPVLAVINKAAGIAVHPAPGLPRGTLANRLVARFPELASLEGFRPGIVHRLDKDTSGLMLVALTEQARLPLAAEFADREVFKEYLALVHAVPREREGRIDAPVGRHPSHKTRMAVTRGGKPAASAWRVLYADPRERFSLLGVRIFTGRTHQVRVHMQYIGHPLLGDSLYAAPHTKQPGRCKAPRQMLHAWRLAFRHPMPEMIAESGNASPQIDDEGRLAFLCPPPVDFIETMLAASGDMLRVVVTGSPGCGKSALVSALQDLGLPCFSADALVADLYRPGADGWHILRARFGDRFVPDDKAPVDKAALAKAMGEDEAVKKQIDSLLHPLVWHALQRFWEQMEKEGHPAAIAEIPLYLESGRHTAEAAPDSRPPLLVGVRCPFSIRRERLLHKRGWTEETIARVESWQWPEEKKMRACDIVVENSKDISALKEKAQGLAKAFESMEKERKHLLRQQFQVLWTSV